MIRYGDLLDLGESIILKENYFWLRMFFCNHFAVINAQDNSETFFLRYCW